MNWLKRSIRGETKLIDFNRLLTGFTRNVILISLGTVISQIIVSISYPLLTRIFSPSELGVYSTFLSLVSIIAVLSSLRYEMAIPLPEKDIDARSLLILALLISGFLSIIIFLITNTFSDSLNSILGNNLQASIVRMISPAFLAGGISIIFSAWLVRNTSYTEIMKSDVSRGIGLAASQVLLGIIGYGSIGLVLGDIFSKVVASVSMIWSSLKTRSDFLSGVSVDSIVDNAVRYRKFPFLSSWSSLLNSAGLNLPLPMLASLYGVEIAGLFALSMKAISAPVSLLGNSIAKVYLGEAAVIGRDDPSQLKALFYNLMRNLFLVGLIPLLLVILFAPTIFEVIFGANWRRSGIFLRLLAPYAFAKFIANPISRTLFIIERQDMQSAWDIARLVVVVISIILPARLDASEKTLVLAFSIAGTLSYISLILLCMFALNKRDSNQK